MLKQLASMSRSNCQAEPEPEELTHLSTSTYGSVTRELDPAEPSPPSPPTPLRGRGWTGKVEAMRRLLGRVAVDANGCWVWLGKLSEDGYGIGPAGRGVHRQAFTLFVGAVPDGMQIDCRVRRCCNPDHLEAVTQTENQRRSPLSMATVNGAKTHCKHGHEFTEENTGHERRHEGLTVRYCKTCKRDRERRAREGQR